ETGDRGAVLATLRPDGSVDSERRSVAVSEVQDLTVTLHGAGHAEEVARAVAQALSGRAGFVRLTLDGEVTASLEIYMAGLRSIGRGTRTTGRSRPASYWMTVAPSSSARTSTARSSAAPWTWASDEMSRARSLTGRRMRHAGSGWTAIPLPRRYRSARRRPCRSRRRRA